MPAKRVAEAAIVTACIVLGMVVCLVEGCL